MFEDPIQILQQVATKVATHRNGNVNVLDESLEPVMSSIFCINVENKLDLNRIASFEQSNHLTGLRRAGVAYDVQLLNHTCYRNRWRRGSEDRNKSMQFIDNDNKCNNNDKSIIYSLPVFPAFVSDSDCCIHIKMMTCLLMHL